MAVRRVGMARAFCANGMARAVCANSTTHAVCANGMARHALAVLTPHSYRTASPPRLHFYCCFGPNLHPEFWGWLFGSVGALAQPANIVLIVRRSCAKKQQLSNARLGCLAFRRKRRSGRLEQEVRRRDGLHCSLWYAEPFVTFEQSKKSSLKGDRKMTFSSYFGIYTNAGIAIMQHGQVRQTAKGIIRVSMVEDVGPDRAWELGDVATGDRGGSGGGGSGGGSGGGGSGEGSSGGARETGSKAGTDGDSSAPMAEEADGVSAEKTSGQ
jgi:uncharacterized membrane protein YgcG